MIVLLKTLFSQSKKKFLLLQFFLPATKCHFLCHKEISFGTKFCFACYKSNFSCSKTRFSLLQNLLQNCLSECDTCNTDYFKPVVLKKKKKKKIIIAIVNSCIIFVYLEAIFSAFGGGGGGNLQIFYIFNKKNFEWNVI